MDYYIAIKFTRNAVNTKYIATSISLHMSRPDWIADTDDEVYVKVTSGSIGNVMKKMTRGIGVLTLDPSVVPTAVTEVQLSKVLIGGTPVGSASLVDRRINPVDWNGTVPLAWHRLALTGNMSVL